MLGDLDPAVTLQAIAGAVRRALGADRATCYVHEPGRRRSRRSTPPRPTPSGALSSTPASAPAAPRCRSGTTCSTSPTRSWRSRTWPTRPLGPRLAGVPAPAPSSASGSSTPRSASTARRRCSGPSSAAGPRPPAHRRRQGRRPRLAALAALALANARLYADAVARLEENAALAAEQAALRRVATVAATAEGPSRLPSVAEEVAGLLGVDCGLVARFEPERILAVGSFGAPPAMLRATLPAAAPAPSPGSPRGRAVRIDDYAALADDPAAELAASAPTAARSPRRSRSTAGSGAR